MGFVDKSWPKGSHLSLNWRFFNFKEYFIVLSDLELHRVAGFISSLLLAEPEVPSVMRFGYQLQADSTLALLLRRYLNIWSI
jgi:hypothetical protein